MRSPLHFVALLAAALVGFGSSDATALGISPNPVDLLDSSSELVARITLVGATTGTPTGAITLSGAAAATDTTLLFVVEYLFAPSIGPLGGVDVVRSGGVWSALGWVPGAGEDWSGTLFGLSSDAFLFSWPLDTGLTSDVFFVSAASLPGGTAHDFAFQGYHGLPYGTGTATIVPEPATLVVLAGGLALLSRAAGRRQEADSTLRRRLRRVRLEAR